MEVLEIKTPNIIFKIDFKIDGQNMWPLGGIVIIHDSLLSFTVGLEEHDLIDAEGRDILSGIISSSVEAQLAILYNYSRPLSFSYVFEVKYANC